MTEIILFILLNICDCITTYQGLQMGLHEGNIFLRELFEKNIYVGLGVKLGFAVVIGVLLIIFGKAHLLAIINIAFALIVIWNLIQIFMFI